MMKYKNANDIEYALKDMFKDTIQITMIAKFNTNTGYEKSDNVIAKTIEMDILLKR